MAASPRYFVVLVLAACNPAPPGGEPGTAGSTTGIGTDGVSSSSSTGTPTTTGATSDTGATSFETSTADAASTTSGETTVEPPSSTSSTTGPDGDTTTGFVCNWHGDPDAEDFCPLFASVNADISGTTPMGPIAFKHAYFGLFPCTDCPYASEGSIAFFGAPDDPKDPTADNLLLDTYACPIVSLTLGGEEIEVHGCYPNDDITLEYVPLDVPDVAETNPPLDPDAPPTLSGKLSIAGGGWNVSGEFTATLCRDFDLQLRCE